MVAYYNFAPETRIPINSHGFCRLLSTLATHKENSMSDYKDITYEVGANAVRITINRPEVFNAFRNQTVEELILAFRAADEEKSVNTVIFGGAGDKAFCTGGDQKVHYSDDGLYGPRGMVGFPIEELQTAIRDCRKVVIARVQGFAIGGGNVFATICDLTIASEKAQFGQVGPKVGSVDPGFGTAYLARMVGEKKAREIWFLCRRYKAQERWKWAWSTRSCRTMTSMPNAKPGRPRSTSSAPPPSPLPSVRSTLTAKTFAASASWAWPR